MKFWHVILILVLIATALAGCGGEQATPAPVDTGEGETQSSAVLDTSYPNALDVSGQLALGTMRLEGMENAVMPQQATALLPLWQAIQGGTLQGEAETNAVLAQIEGEMMPEQLAAIAALQLSQDDLRAWAQDQGLSLGTSSEERATRQAEGGGQEHLPGAQLPGGGQGGGKDGLGSGSAGLSQEEIEAMRATAEASGGRAGVGRAGASGQQFTLLLEPLVELLTQRAAE